MTRMPGIAVRYAKLAGETRREALKGLGRMLRQEHSIPQEPLKVSGLLFGDQSPVDVRWRLGSLFDDLTEMIKQDKKTWNYPVPPEIIGRRLMKTLPNEKHIVALHSNPGPEHTFVDPATGELTGMIDFGDAYFSHPVNDLRRYRTPEDRAAVLAGYLECGRISEAFMDTWRVGCAISDITAIASSPDHQSAAAEELDQILSEIA
jgi:hygromycin-B 7''-O-kinase